MSDTILTHAQRFYDLMYEASQDEVVEGDTLRIFRGTVGEIWNELNVSQSYYTRIMKFLSDSGCIAVLQKASRNVLSVIVLTRRPVAEDRALRDLTGARGAAKLLADRVERLEELIGGMNVVSAFENIENRLQELEGSSHIAKRLTALPNITHTNK